MYKCESCHSNMIWQNDFDYEDYLIEDREGIVTVYLCPSCELIHEIFINFDNEVEDTWVSSMEDEE